MWSLGALPDGFPAAAYAAYAAGRGYSGYPSFGLPYPAVDLTNGQLTPNNNTPLLTQALSGSSGASWTQPSGADQTAPPQPHFSVSFAVMNNYQAAAAAAQGFGPPASPHAASTRGGFPAANSPGPTIDMYNSSAGDSVGYVQAASPQPSSFPAIAVSRAPLNYSPGPLIPAAFTNGYH
jgi:RNA-binding protein Musashi